MTARECHGMKRYKQSGNGTRPDTLIKEQKKKKRKCTIQQTWQYLRTGILHKTKREQNRISLYKETQQMWIVKYMIKPVIIESHGRVTNGLKNL